MQTFKLLGLLLDYPEESLQHALSELGSALEQEALLPKKQLEAVQDFIAAHAKKDLIDWQEEYIKIFDRSRNHSLYLFEHVHGESRDRGTAMVDLKEVYLQKGLDIGSNELPDYLPLFLEYLSFCDAKEAKNMLGETVDIIATIATHMENRNIPYAVLFKSLESLSDTKVDFEKVSHAVENAPKDAETFEEVDALWEEADAFASEEDCNGCDSKEQESQAQHILSGVIQ